MKRDYTEEYARLNQAIANAATRLLGEWIKDGVRKGKEWVGTNPARSDNRPGSFSVNIHTGKWGDFSTDDTGGDFISLYAYLKGLSQSEAKKELERILTLTPAEPAKPAKPKPPEWVAILPVPDDAFKPPTRHPIHLEPNRIWTYTDAEGRLLGYVWRHDRINSKGEKVKEIVPVTFCHTEGNPAKRSWRFKHFPEPRPLYGLDRLAAKPGAPVLVVEGEKCADAGDQYLGALAVVTWPGGGNAWQKADWSPLAGRQVLLWPDADPAGYKTMEGDGAVGKFKPGLAHHLDGLGAQVKIIDPPIHHILMADKWDLADAMEPKQGEPWTARQLAAYVKDAKNKRPPYLPELEPEQEPEPEPELPPAGPDPEPARQDEAPPAFDAAEYGIDVKAPPPSDIPYQFKFLGYDHGTYFYLASRGQQVIALAARQHTENNLYTLAPLDFWRAWFPPETKSGAFNTSQAANALIERSHQVGPFDPDRLRGRGAWWDDGRYVLHMGDKLIIDNKPVDITTAKTRYIYERAIPMRADVSNPLTAAEAENLLVLCNMLNWEKPVYGDLLAGWLAIADICGAMQWRPHLWLTGEAGSGKSWVYDHIVKRVTQDYALKVLGDTSEAGIRQSLGQDARPVVFDEAESNTKEDQARIQKILGLMRVASSETDAVIAKGSAGGQAKGYKIRSMFAFSSIGVGLEQFADKTRVSVLTLLRDDRAAGAKEKTFDNLCKFTADTLSDEFITRLHARVIRLIPVIRANAKTFARAAATVIGTQRLGDQVGALLAGAYALRSDAVLTLDQARAYVDLLDWTNEKALSNVSDQVSCLSHILEHTLRIQGVNMTVEQSIGELVLIAGGRLFDQHISPDNADQHLRRVGIMVTEDKGFFIVSNTHKSLKAILSNTQWAQKWGPTLQRIKGDYADGIPWKAVATDPLRFAPGTPTARGTRLPIEAINC